MTALLTEPQMELLAQKLTQCLPTDRDAIMDFLEAELLFASKELPADDATFIAALQVSLDAEASRHTDDEGIVPNPRADLDSHAIYKRVIGESYRLAPLPPERQQAVDAAEYRRLSPAEKEIVDRYEAVKAAGALDVEHPSAEAVEAFAAWWDNTPGMRRGGLPRPA
jgi:hypothetical protein